MKIHSDTLTVEDIHTATREAGMRGVYADVIAKGSRSRKRGFEVKLSGTNTRLQNPGTSRDRSVEQAATWDEWGMFINALYQLDSNAIIGPYRFQQHFDEVTYSRFEALTAPYAHGNHKWENRGDGTSQCKFCEAEYDFKGAFAKAV